MFKSSFEHLLLTSRWLLTLFYAALALALLALLGKVLVRLYDLATQFVSLSEEQVLLSELAIVDLTLSASLIVIVIVSGYANFVSRLDIAVESDWPRWIADIDFSELKAKLMATIVAISAIKLLEVFMDVDHATDRDIGWQTGIVIVFVVAAVLLAFADRLGNGRKASEH